MHDGGGVHLQLCEEVKADRWLRRRIGSGGVV